jgi:hypothetical protein
LLNDAKTKLDSEVSSNTITQSQSDQIYQKLTDSIDSLLNNTQMQMQGGRGMPWGFPNNKHQGGSSNSGA